MMTMMTVVDCTAHYAERLYCAETWIAQFYLQINAMPAFSS